MSQELERRLAEALAALDAGQDVDAVLAEYPEKAGELAPLLETADQARETLDYFEPPSSASLVANRRRMLEAAARKRSTTTPSRWQTVLARLRSWFRSPARGLATAILLLALFVVAGGATVVAAAASLPGDPLYGVKRATEQVRLALSIDPAADARLHAQFNRERQAEALAVAAQRRQAQVQFKGRLEERRNGTWVVDGIELQVEPQTVDRTPAVGSTVVVDVVSPGDGTLHVEHMQMHSGPHMPATITPDARGPVHEPGRSAPPATPHRGRGRLSTDATPSPQSRPTEMQPGQRHQGPPAQPTQNQMGRPSMPPQPTHGPRMGQVTPTPVPTEMPPSTPAQAPPAQPAPTDTPIPQPTHHGPMMTPQPTRDHQPGPPHPTQRPGGGGPGGGGSRHSG